MSSQNESSVPEDQSKARKTRSRSRAKRSSSPRDLNISLSSDEESCTTRSSSRIKAKKLNKYKQRDNLHNNRGQNIKELLHKTQSNESQSTPRKLESMSKLSTNWCITQVSTTKYTYKWNVLNFSLSSNKIGKALSSSEFEIPQFSNLKCRLLLYSNGHEENCKNNVCVIVQYVAQNILDINCELKFLNDNGIEVTDVFTIKTRCLDKELTNSESSCVKTKSKLLSLLKNDELILLCSFSINDSIIHKTSRDDAQYVDESQNKLEVLNDLYKLTKNKEFCDVILCVENKEYFAHKTILAGRSLFFKQLFQDYLIEKEIKKFDISNVKSSTFEEILSFIYRGKIYDMKNSASDLLEAANKFNLRDMKIMCERYLIKNLSIDNVFQNLILAENLGTSDLKNKAKNFMMIIGPCIVDFPGFKMVKNFSADLYQEIFCLFLTHGNT